MSRVILHMDANCFYASVECLYHPELRGKPVAVCGDPEARHGIVLTANYPAKRMGVHVGMAVWQAKQACPALVPVAPNYPLYIHFSGLLRKICQEYSDRVEAFGLDESWVDVSDTETDVLRGGALADALRERVKNELGITVSIGVADNKIFAKLGSDLKKPDGTTVISPRAFRTQIWPLPASQLLYVGPATTRRLRALNILTIGDLAKADSGVLQTAIGKNGLLLQAFALGLDTSPVMPVSTEEAVKSIGNSTTTPHDIATREDAKCVFYLLAESVSARLREAGFKARCISVSVRRTTLERASCQTTFKAPTDLTDDISRQGFQLFEERFLPWLPLRSAGLCCDRLTRADEPVQLDLREDMQERMKRENLDRALDGLRRRYGHNVVQRGVVLADPVFAALSPKEDNTVHPVPFFAG